MKTLPFSDKMAELLGRYLDAGGCVAYAQVEVDGDGEVDYQAVNLAATDVVARQYWGDHYLEQAQNIDPQQAAKLQDIRPELMQSQVISLEQFMGPYYDVSTKRLIVRGLTNDHLNDHFWHDDEETAANVIPWRQVDPFETRTNLYKGYTQGYANAFWGGPYSLRGLTIRQIGELFNDINHELFNDFRGEQEIRLWSNDWWPYFFSAGLEYDGAYWWTVHDKTRGRVIVATTSVTD